MVEGRSVNMPLVEDFAKTANRRGWAVKVIGGIDYRKIGENDFEDLFSDYVVYRALCPSTVSERERLKEWLRRSGKVVININEAGGVAMSADKFFQHGVMMNEATLREHILPAYLVRNKEEVRELIDEGKMRFPFIIKKVIGTTGKGIVLMRDEAALEKYADGFSDVFVEPYVEADFEWRVFVMGEKAVGVMRKEITETEEVDFRARSRGEKRSKEEDEEILRTVGDLAVAAAKALNEEYAGVDIVREKATGRYYVLESNAGAGWMNHFTEVTGVNIGDKVIDWFEEKAKERGELLN